MKSVLTWTWVTEIESVLYFNLNYGIMITDVFVNRSVSVQLKYKGE